MQRDSGLGRAAWLIVVGFAILLGGDGRAELGAHDYSVEITAAVSESPARITLSWVGDTNATSYAISRKLRGEGGWNFKANVGGATVTWTDPELADDLAYEYQIVKKTVGGYAGYGYVTAAIRRAVVEDRGRLVLLVEESLTAPLALELLQLQQDLVGDGWRVLRHDVGRTQAVTAIKALIKADYDADPAQTKALFLFGNIPVPHSGDIAPDVHPDHQGAWPADVYYGEFSGAWTDATVTRTNNFTSVPNVPGDGKFDQSEPPGPVALQIGRVDLSNLTCFANKNPARYEVDLARNYLHKDHQFRHGLMEVKRRGLVYDNGQRGVEPEPQACAAWRSFPGFFGNDQIKLIGPTEFLPLLSNESYLWAYVRSTGSYYNVDWVASSDDWALNSPKVVFTSFLGSYLGEWDKESDFLRAPLGTSGYTLTCIYSGQPQWILHPMALGDPIGYCALLTQNNRTNGVYPPQVNAGAGQVHIALMGDPTLRLHPVGAPGRVQGSVDADGVTLSWGASADTNVIGYFVYKSGSAGGPFARISGGTAVNALSYPDGAGTAQDFYMVRALKLERTPSGNYDNLSQGAFYPDTVSGNGGPPETPSDFSAIKLTQRGVVLEWLERSYGVRAFEIQRRLYPAGSFQTIGEASGIDARFADSTAPAQMVAYRLRALGFDGNSDFTEEAVVNLQPAAATIVGIDTSTRGNWIGKYGSEGLMIPFATTNYPSYVTVAANNATPVLTLANSNDRPESLLRPDGQSRLLSECASEWRNTYRGTMELNFRFKDSWVHRVSIYMVDYHGGTRTGRLEVYDPYFDQILKSVNFANYTNGQYITLELRNFADVRITPTDSANVTSFSGLFFETPILDIPTISPSGGIFTGKTTVSMSSTPGAAILFTTDGTEPGPNSFYYNGPFILRTNATIVARAFKEGYRDAGAARAVFINDFETAVTLIGNDTSTQGDWRPRYGTTGSMMFDGPQKIPAYAEIDLRANQIWMWTESTTEKRALNSYNSYGTRLATAWFAPQDVIADVTLYTNQLQQVALYFLDWDGGRTQDVIVTDATGRTLSQTRLEHFEGGQYLVFAAKGSFRISARHVAGYNSIINAVFIGGGVKAGLLPLPLISGGNFNLQIEGEAGQVYDIQSTRDFQTWITETRQTLSGSQLDWSIPWTDEPGMKIYRALLAP